MESKTIVLKKGSQRASVKLLQSKLTELGYVCDIDGIFGSDTQDAVIAFQRDNGLAPDGIVGIMTWTAMGISVNSLPEDNVEDFIAWALLHVKPESIPDNAELLIPLYDCGIDPWEYLYGTSGRICTQSLLDEKYERYYKDWSWSRALYDQATDGWVENGVMVSDCQGLLDAYCTQVLEVRTDLNAHGCYSSWCTEKGRIRDISRAYVIGEAVFRANEYGTMKHIGWVCGFDHDGEPLVVEERGLSYGCVVTRLSGRGWTHRGLMTERFEYGASPVVPNPDIDAGAFHAICSGGSVHVRTGPGTEYESMGIAHASDPLLAMHPCDGWCRIAALMDGDIITGYMSAKYIEEA